MKLLTVFVFDVLAYEVINHLIVLMENAGNIGTLYYLLISLMTLTLWIGFECLINLYFKALNLVKQPLNSVTNEKSIEVK